MAPRVRPGLLYNYCVLVFIVHWQIAVVWVTGPNHPSKTGETYLATCRVRIICFWSLVGRPPVRRL